MSSYDDSGEIPRSVAAEGPSDGDPQDSGPGTAEAPGPMLGSAKDVLASAGDSGGQPGRWRDEPAGAADEDVSAAADVAVEQGNRPGEMASQGPEPRERYGPDYAPTVGAEGPEGVSTRPPRP
jgi:hypothetical protein